MMFETNANNEFFVVCHEIMKENFPSNPDFISLGLTRITIQFDQEEKQKVLCHLPIYEGKIKDVSKPFCLWLPSHQGFIFFTC